MFGYGDSDTRLSARPRYGLGWAILLSILWGMTALHVLAEGTLGLSGGEPRVERDIIYYDGPEFYAPRHILDVYLPASQSAGFPVLIFIHGGAWRSGNKNSYGFLGNTFARAGFGVVIANYRLTDDSPGSVMHPGHIQDVARVFAWVQANIADYGGNPEKIFISGHSAGGHLVALLAVDAQYLAAHKLSPDDIAGVIGVSGVYDVRGASLAPVFGEDPAQRAQASPITHVGEIAPPPFQILYAENDLPGLGPQAVMFNQALLSLPAESELIMVLGRDHGSIIRGVAMPDDPVTQAMVRFITEH